MLKMTDSMRKNNIVLLDTLPPPRARRLERTKPLSICLSVLMRPLSIRLCNRLMFKANLGGDAAKNINLFAYLVDISPSTPERIIVPRLVQI